MFFKLYEEEVVLYTSNFPWQSQINPPPKESKVIDKLIFTSNLYKIQLFACKFILLYVDGAEQKQTNVDKPWREQTEWTEEVWFLYIVSDLSYNLTISSRELELAGFQLPTSKSISRG